MLSVESRNATILNQFTYDVAYNDVPVNADNQITSNNSVFDGQGNPSIYNNVPLTFDAENRLTAINNNEFFSYDGAGRRVSKTLNGATTYYNYSGSTLLSEDTFPATGTPYSVLYDYAADGLRSAYYPTTSANSYRAGLFDFVFDPEGNLVQRLDFTESGVLPGIDKLVTFSAYGSPQSASQVASPNGNIYQVAGGATAASIGFGGQYGYYTDESGLILLGARYYDPGTHRFLNRDPIDYKGGANLYAFCDGNPVNEIDPSGNSGNLKTAWGDIVAIGKFIWNGFTKPTTSMTSIHNADEQAAMARLDGGSYAKTYNAYMANSFAVQKTSMFWGNTGEEALGGFALPWKNEVPSVQEAKESVVLAEETEDLIEGPALSKADRMAANKADGDAWRDELADFFRASGKTVKPEVVKETPLGLRRVDLEVSDGNKVLGGIEAKVGGSRYLPSQRAKDWWLWKRTGYQVIVVRKP